MSDLEVFSLSRLRFRLLILLACCMVSVIFSGCSTQTTSANASAGRSEIVTDSDETPERKRARIRVELALGYFEQGKTNIALDEIKQAIAADPNFSDSYSLRGLVYMRLNDFGFAEDSFKKALSIKPKDANILHNLGWLKCQQGQFSQAVQIFSDALSDPLYGGRAKTLMAQGLCQAKAGMDREAEASLIKAYEFDAANPVTGYNLASLLLKRGDFVRAQFYIRRLNNSEFANAESLWLGVKIENRLGNAEARQQLGAQLEKRFSQSHQAELYRSAAFND